MPLANDRRKLNVVGMVLSLLLFAVFHPVHETISEVQWNGEAGRLEVALRLDTLDEQWLQERWGRSRKHRDWALDCLRQRFRVADSPDEGDADTTKYQWVGRQEEGAHVWWFFEIETSGGQRPSWIEQRMFAEHRSPYTHRILILGPGRRETIVLNAQKRRGELNLKD